MYLYNLTLQRASGITHAVHGYFSGTEHQEIIVSKGKTLELLRPDPNSGKILTLLTLDIFSVIRSLLPFRPTDGYKDYVVVGSDSGTLVIFEYVPQKNTFEKVHRGIFGKDGCRRIVPGEHLAIDPKGRAIMIGAVEKQKLVYFVNKDAEHRLIISPPLESHKNNTLTYHMVGVDVGFKKPLFACLEIDYEEADKDPSGKAAIKTQQSLVFYECNPSTSEVVRKYSELLKDHANFLISIPGSQGGPSGILICSENHLTYKSLVTQQDTLHCPLRCPIPRRRNDLDNPERGMIFVCSATHMVEHNNSLFFIFIQSEQGDIFKVTLEFEDNTVSEIRLKYFDTVPVASAMCILKTGFLFVASEFGNHHLYQIAHLGVDDDEPEFSSAIPLEEGDTFFFAPRHLRNLVLADELESLSPIMDCHITDLAKEDIPQLYMVCGRGPRSTLRVLRHRLDVSEMGVSELPSNPNAVWAIKRRVDDEFDAYIVVSFVNSTLVLSIGNSGEEVNDSGYLGVTSTLACFSMGDDTTIQVHSEGFRHIRADKRFHDWNVPGKKQIVKCAANQKQVIIAMTGGLLAYFEMESSGQLEEFQRKEMGCDVVCVALACVPSGERLSRFAAIGLADETINILSLDHTNCMVKVSMQEVPSRPSSLCIVDVDGTIYLNAGLQIGILLRIILDPVTGDLHNTRTRYLGTRPVKLFSIVLQGQAAILAVSSRCWLSYSFDDRYHLTPLNCESLEYASSFASQQCPEGIVAVSSNTLKILAIEKLGCIFNQISFPLEYTPRKFVIHQETGYMIIIETEHNAYTEQTKNHMQIQMAKEMVEAAGENEMEIAREMARDFLNDDLPEKVFGSAKAGAGTWASVIRIISPVTGQTLSVTRLEQNEAALCLAVVKFANQPDNETFVVVGVAKDYQLNLRQISSAYLCTYRLTGSTLELVHRTLVEELPTALCGFHGKLLAGVGRLLRLYDMGKKKLLRKCENKHIPNQIVRLEWMGKRIYASDIQESVFFIRYKDLENQLIIFADDTQPRWVTTSCVLDYNTVATADKFGNIAIVRLGSSVIDDVDEDPMGNKALWDRGLLNGASQKADFVASFHVGEVVMSLQNVTLISGSSESLVYTTLSGGIGALVPFTSHEDKDFFHHLEIHMRRHNPTLTGRDHLSYRSYFYPLKNVIDGDLCEQYTALDSVKQNSIANELNRTPNEIIKKLKDISIKYAY